MNNVGDSIKASMYMYTHTRTPTPYTHRIIKHKARALANETGYLDMDAIVKNLVNCIQVMESL